MTRRRRARLRDLLGDVAGEQPNSVVAEARSMGCSRSMPSPR